MASQSSATEAGEAEYERGWAAITRAMDAGASWSGHERNGVFLNLGISAEGGPSGGGGSRFVDVSGAVGLDFVDDGRLVAETDWNGDGAPDLWLRNRTAPQLRLLEGRVDAARALAIELVGTACNTGAVGARVEVHAGGRVLVREVRAGDGYLSQSTRRLSFGLGGAGVAEKLVVRWPGGAPEKFDGVRAGSYRLAQGSGELAPVAGETRGRVETVNALDDGPLEVASGGAARVPLRTALPLPPPVLQALARRSAAGGAAPERVRLVNLWAQWCAPCVVELREFASRATELDAAGVEIVALCVDRDEDRAAAEQLFAGRIAPPMTAPGFPFRAASPELLDVLRALVEHIVPGRGERALPVSLLVDTRGWVRAAYLGPVSVEALLSDAAALRSKGPQEALSGDLPGRWFFGVPRDLPGLAGALGRLGRRREAAFYESVARGAGKR